MSHIHLPGGLSFPVTSCPFFGVTHQQRFERNFWITHEVCWPVTVSHIHLPGHPSSRHGVNALMSRGYYAAMHSGTCVSIGNPYRDIVPCHRLSYSMAVLISKKTLSRLCFLLLSSSTIWKFVVTIHVTFRHLLVCSKYYSAIQMSPPGLIYSIFKPSISSCGATLP